MEAATVADAGDNAHAVGQFWASMTDVRHAQVGRGEPVDALDADLPADAVVDLPTVARCAAGYSRLR